MAGPGRPSLYSDELASRICERLALGESLNKICRDDEMPEMRTVHRWLAQDSAFLSQYAKAREIQADTLADKAVDRADEATKDDAPAVRVYLDAVKWFSGVVAPRKYTPKTATSLSGDADAPPIRVVTEIKRTIVDPAG